MADWYSEVLVYDNNHTVVSLLGDFALLFLGTDYFQHGVRDIVSSSGTYGGALYVGRAVACMAHA